MIEAYPLCWPDGWKRTPSRRNSIFKVSTVGAASKRVLHELVLLGAKSVVISTNLQLRLDGLPYTNQAQPKDGGVAVYFSYKGKQMCFACDTYHKIQENLVAVAKTIEALRGMERWGASQMMERAFTGFASLPAKTAGRYWRDVLLFEGGPVTLKMIDTRYRALARQRHPDTGGSHEAMAELNAAREAALEEVSKWKH